MKGVADTYLDLAEKILLHVRRPLKARTIMDAAYTNELLPWHLRGARQDRTLQARLSEDIAKNHENSVFFRNGPGLFFLRRFLTDATIPNAYKEVFNARPRRKDLARERILALNLDIGAFLRDDNTTVSLSRIVDALQGGRYVHENYQTVVSDPRLMAVHSFVIIHQHSSVLSFRYGTYFPNVDPLFGTRSIGLGSAVTAENIDMLFDSFFGIVASGVEELIYGVGLPRPLTRTARYANGLRPRFGVVSYPRRRQSPVLHLIMSYRCPDGFQPMKSALSINDLRWIDAGNPANSLDDFDSTSAFLFRQDYVRDIIRDHDAT